jgi:hypothetical protein
MKKENLIFMLFSHHGVDFVCSLQVLLLNFLYPFLTLLGKGM